MTTAEIDRLPDPDLYRDAKTLAVAGYWSPRDLDETDALLLAVIRQFQNVRRG